MSSKIPNIIPERKFETVRDKIVSILTDELTNQYSLTTNSLYQAGIFKERFVPFDKTELPAILVYFNNSEFDSKIPNNCKSDTTYAIEVHTRSSYTDSERGDTKASVDCDKLLGAIHYILSSPYYYNLDLPGVVQTTMVESLQIGRNSDPSGDSIVVGLLSFKVRIMEDNGAIPSTQLDEVLTTFNEEFKIKVET